MKDLIKSEMKLKGMLVGHIGNGYNDNEGNFHCLDCHTITEFPHCISNDDRFFSCYNCMIKYNKLIKEQK